MTQTTDGLQRLSEGRRNNLSLTETEQGLLESEKVVNTCFTSVVSNIRENIRRKRLLLLYS